MLEEDPFEIQRAARDAGQMTEYLRERAITQERKQPTKTQAELTHEYSHERGPQIGHTPKRPAPDRAQAHRAGRGTESIGGSLCLIRETLRKTPGPGPRRSRSSNTETGAGSGPGRRRDGSRGFDPRTDRQDFKSRIEQAVAEIGIYRSVAYKDISEAHFDSHPYATRAGRWIG